MDMAQDALTQNLPGEATKIMQAGMKIGVIGQGPQKDRHMRLIDMAKKQSADEQAALAKRDADAQASPTGDADVALGVSYWSYGQNDKAVDAIQGGIKKGTKDKDEAQLRLGMAFLSAGKKAQADAAFKAVKPNTYAGQIARLWSLYASTR